MIPPCLVIYCSSAARRLASPSFLLRCTTTCDDPVVYYDLEIMVEQGEVVYDTANQHLPSRVLACV